jgi:hypothetical protein
MREKFTTGSVPFRKTYLQSLIDVVEVDDHQIRIKGSKDVLERAVLAEQSPTSGSQMSTRWRARRDSNSRPLPSESKFRPKANWRTRRLRRFISPRRSPTRCGASAAYGELRPGALGPASRLRRRYADAPAGAPRCAPSAPARARRRVPPASKGGLLAAFFFAMNAPVCLQETRSAAPITRIPALVYYAAQFLLARARPVASSRILQSWEGPS